MRRPLNSCIKSEVFKLWMPLHCGKSKHFMLKEKTAHANGNILIEQDAQCGNLERKQQLLQPEMAEARTVEISPLQSCHSRNCRQWHRPACGFHAERERR